MPTLLVDADVYGGVVAQVLGLLDESPGLAAAARLADTGTLDLPALARLAWSLDPHLRVLTGMARADRWPELRPAAVEQRPGRWPAPGRADGRRLRLLPGAGRGALLRHRRAAPQRRDAGRARGGRRGAGVGAADPVGLQRLVRGLAELREAVPGVVPGVVVNQVRRGRWAATRARQLAEALARYAGIDVVDFVP